MLNALLRPFLQRTSHVMGHTAFGPPARATRRSGTRATRRSGARGHQVRCESLEFRLLLTQFFEQEYAANPLAGSDFEVSGYAAPALGDLDADGDLDVLLGTQNGQLRYFRNIGTQTDPQFRLVTGSASPTGETDFGTNVVPALGDLDGDGDLDVVLGRNDGFFDYLENTGSATRPVFTIRTGPSRPLPSVDVGHDAAPTLGDIDNDGDLDLVVGARDSVIHFFRNDGGSITEQTGSQNPVANVREKSPLLVDLDDDGDLDLISANSVGEGYWQNNGTPAVPSFVEVDAATPGIARTARLAGGDLNGDGNVDLLAGNRDGEILFFRQLPDGPVVLGFEPLYSTRSYIGNGQTSARQVDGSDFGILVDATPQTHQFQLRRTTAPVLNVTSVELTGSGASAFSLSESELFEPEHAFLRDFGITFTPESIGEFTATVRIMHDGPEGVFEFAVRGVRGEMETLQVPDGGGRYVVRYDDQQIRLMQGGTVAASHNVSATTAGVIIGGTNAADVFRLHPSLEGFDRTLVIRGEGGNDKVNGRGVYKAVEFHGNSGRDRFLGGVLNDTIYGGSGHDRIDTGNSSQTDSSGNVVFAGRGNDTVQGGDGLDVIHGGAGNDLLNAGNGFNSIFGDAGNDQLIGGNTTDRLNGGGGNDTLRGNEGNDHLTGGWGDDDMDGGVGVPTGGGDEIDRIQEAANTSFVLNNTTLTGLGNDTLRGFEYAQLSGGNGPNHIDTRGFSGHVVVRGMGGRDTLLGGAGGSFLDGGDGADLIIGGSSNDSIRGGRGADSIAGGDGRDTIDGEQGADQLLGQSGDDRIFGGSSGDTILGGPGNDVIRGSGGADIILGEAGDDDMNGGSSTDVGTGGGNSISASAGDIVRTELIDDSFSFNTPWLNEA